MRSTLLFACNAGALVSGLQSVANVHQHLSAVFSSNCVTMQRLTLFFDSILHKHRIVMKFPHPREFVGAAAQTFRKGSYTMVCPSSMPAVALTGDNSVPVDWSQPENTKALFGDALFFSDSSVFEYFELKKDDNAVRLIVDTLGDKLLSLAGWTIGQVLEHSNPFGISAQLEVAASMEDPIARVAELERIRTEVVDGRLKYFAHMLGRVDKISKLDLPEMWMPTNNPAICQDIHAFIDNFIGSGQQADRESRYDD